jgi:hypothetical protein
MNITKALTGFKNYSDDELRKRAETIVTNLVDSEIFINPIPGLPEIEEATTAYALALKKLEMGTPMDYVAKNNRRKELENILRRLCNYINLTAPNDRLALMSSGFEVSKIRETASSLTRPEKVKLVHGENPGEMLLSSSPVKGALSYLHQYTTVDPNLAPATWESFPSTTSRYLLTSLEVGRCYWFRVVVLGTRGQVKYSNVLSKFIS